MCPYFVECGIICLDVMDFILFLQTNDLPNGI